MSKIIWWVCDRCEIEFEDKDWLDATCPECGKQDVYEREIEFE